MGSRWAALCCWAAAGTAAFLGYATVLTGEAADRVARAAGLAGHRSLALRRSALYVAGDGAHSERRERVGPAASESLARKLEQRSTATR